MSEPSLQIRTDAPAPWERGTGEPDRSYAAFVVYRDLGPGRSLEQVARSLADDGNQTGAERAPKRAPISGNRLKKLSAQYDWVERCRAWDASLQRQRDRIAAEASALAAEEWERRRMDHAEKAWAESQRLIEKASLLIGMPVTTRTVSADGKLVTIEAIPPHALRAAAAILRDAAMLGWTAIHEALPDEADFDPKEATTEELHEIVARAGRRR